MCYLSPSGSLRVWDGKNWLEVFIPDLNDDLIAVKGHQPSPTFHQALDDLKSLGFRSGNVGQLNTTGILICSEVAADVNKIAGHG